jgi:hypothetical protein
LPQRAHSTTEPRASGGTICTIPQSGQPTAWDRGDDGLSGMHVGQYRLRSELQSAGLHTCIFRVRADRLE